MMLKNSLYIEPKKTFKELINNSNANANAITLGKPTIKLEFETNEELVNFQERFNNIQSDLEPVNFDKKRGFYNDELSGIEFKTKEDLENYLKENISPFRRLEFNVWNINKEFPDIINIKDKNNKDSFVFVVKTALSYIYLRDAQLKKIVERNRKKYFGLIKPTLLDPILVVKDNKTENIIFVKSFNGIDKDLLIFVSVFSDYDLFTRSNYEKTLSNLWNNIKTKACAIFCYENNGYATTINGVSSTQFEIVDIPLFNCKDEIKVYNNQIFNQKSLGAYGDFYEIYDLRSRAKKELDELKANKNIYFKKVENKSIHNLDKKLFNLTKDTPSYEIDKKIKDTEYFGVMLYKNYDGGWDYHYFLFFPTILKKQTFVGDFVQISVTVNLNKVTNWRYYDYKEKTIEGYITKDYKKELYKDAINKALTDFKQAIATRSEGKWKTETEKRYKYFKMYYENPTAYKITNEKGHEYADGLNAPHDLYIISDTRLKSKKDLDEIKSLQKYNIQPFKPEEYTSDTGVKLVLLKNIKKDTARFQNRENAESSESVNRIINAVKKGDFNWAAFDPVVLWKDPQDGNIYVLSGHSRTRAFEILSEQGATVNGKDFNRIPAKFFEGSEQDAIDFALNSNTLSTKETDVERAKYYRRLIGTMPEYKLKELAEQNEGKNANRILAYAHLRPGSYTLNALTRLQDSSTENAELVKTVADWIGRLFIQFPQLTLEHDKEIFNWLMLEGHYGIGAGKINNYQKLLDVIRLAVFRLQSKDGFESEKRLNLSNVGGESDSMKNYNEKLKQLNNEIKNANAELKAKRKEFLQRQKLDSTITRADIERALKPYSDNIINLQKQIIDLNANKSKYLDADKKQRSLFGISREANIWNSTKLDCKGFKPTYKKLNSYDSFFKKSKNLDELAGYGINDTIYLIKDCVKKNYKSCAAIAQHLKANSIPQSIFNVWYWLHENVKYNYDAVGKEQLRTPERVWADRQRGVDCDCLSIFAYCTLLCMNLKPVFEIAKFNGKNQYSHIYVVCNDIVLDRVWPTFNEKAPFISEVKQFSVKIPTQLETLAGMF